MNRPNEKELADLRRMSGRSKQEQTDIWKADAADLLRRKLDVFMRAYRKKHPGFEISDEDLGHLIFLWDFDWNLHNVLQKAVHRRPELAKTMLGKHSSLAELVLETFWKHRPFAIALLVELESISSSVDALDVFLATTDAGELAKMAPRYIRKIIKHRYGAEAEKGLSITNRAISQRRTRYLAAL